MRRVPDHCFTASECRIEHNETKTERNELKHIAIHCTSYRQTPAIVWFSSDASISRPLLEFYGDLLLADLDGGVGVDEIPEERP